MVFSAASIKQARRHQKFVGDRIEHAAERGLLGPDAGEITVEEVRDAGGDEDGERDPAQPQPAMQDVLPEHAGDHERHRDNAAVSQDVRQRERMGA